jgi:hypothetical protein
MTKAQFKQLMDKLDEISTQLGNSDSSMNVDDIQTDVRALKKTVEDMLEVLKDRN